MGGGAGQADGTAEEDGVEVGVAFFAAAGRLHAPVHSLAYAHTAADFYKHSYIFHYTYGIEYTLQGRPQGFNTIGEWSLDKRHYGPAHPPRRRARGAALCSARGSAWASGAAAARGGAVRADTGRSAAR